MIVIDADTSLYKHIKLNVKYCQCYSSIARPFKNAFRAAKAGFGARERIENIRDQAEKFAFAVIKAFFNGLYRPDLIFKYSNI